MLFFFVQLPMVSRSGYLNSLIFNRRNNGEADAGMSVPIIQLDSLPGGCQTFELVVKFCYGLSVNLTGSNIAPLYCAAHFLEMGEDLKQGNLISRTEAFLSFLMLSSWKDMFRILKNCEAISAWAEELKILERCSESIAWKACMDPQAISCGDDEAQCLNVLTNNFNESKINTKDGAVGSHTEAESNWWFEDVSRLRIDHFIKVINAVKNRGMRSDVIGSCIIKWTEKWLLRIKKNIHDHLNEEPRVTIESLVKVLPTEKDSVCCNFLLHLLKVGMVMNINPELLMVLEKRVALLLESCSAGDLMVKNHHGDKDSVYDANLIIRVVEAYVSCVSSNSISRISVVASVVDEYLALVSMDSNLSVKSFQLLAEALPEAARSCHDRLYRAMDAYLKSHPILTEEERESVCRAMDYHKLSQEARKHAMRNDRLPSNFMVRFILLDHLNMARSMVDDTSRFQRTKTQAFITVSKSPAKNLIRTQKELEIMKQEVKRLKLQLNDLQLCRLELQKKVKRGAR
ncbi:PREDICTED: coleoptile phototropism protein 1-like isoform X1 [Nelumbo nucifera]|uniref:Coleoptile phototropism protein 1-like isoform X1 n=2 Tax=Nelumbo nucifera TaxID=4432 RepID=A0A1U8Q3F5_NELNU|nr:PREDICTED: coleoptile phototropism protein 1-like isoform X1 [Nelumbo nucifera]